MNEKKIELVRQMLAKAESTTPEEAEALTAAAEKIMIRLGIDDAMLAASGSQDDSPVVAKNITFEGAYSDGMVRSMYAVLLSLQTCSAVHIRGRKADSMRVYGRESQVDRAIMLMRSLEIQAIVAMRDWWKANRDSYYWMSESQKKRQRREFIPSFGSGAADRIKSERTEAEAEVAGSALVLLDEVGRATAAIHEEYPRLGHGRALARGGNGAVVAGHEAGRRANVGTTQVGNRKQVNA